jgi:hypothetical protein
LKNQRVAVRHIRLAQNIDNGNNWHNKANHAQHNQQEKQNLNPNNIQQYKGNRINNVKVNVEIERLFCILFDNRVIADYQNHNGYTNRDYGRAKKYRSVAEGR